MSDYFSLVIFTLLSQSAVGLMIAQAFRQGVHNRGNWLALILLALGALASLGHLGDPWIAALTVGNIGSSWLSREIAMCIIFGISILACIVMKRLYLQWLSAIMGVLFVFVMARIYMLPTEPAWNSYVTFFYFLSAALMLGYSLMLILEQFDQNTQNPLLGYGPFVLMGVMCISVLCVFLRLPNAESPARASAIWYIVLLVLSTGMALPALVRHAAKYSGEIKSGLFAMSAIACIIFIAEICGRVSFYKSYIWFGM